MFWAVVAWVAPFVLGYIFLSWVRRWIWIDNINKRYILITGCDHGYGNQLAQRLDMLGCHVFAACTNEVSKNRLQQLTSSKLRAFTLDVTNDDSVKQAVDFVKVYVNENEGLWGLVNCADTFGDVVGPIEWHTMRDVTAVMETNTLSVIRVTQAFLSLIKKSRGRVVNVCPVEGRVIHPHTIPFGVSKAAVEAFSDGLRVHLLPYGASVHVIEHGSFQSDIAHRQRVRKATQQGWKSLPRGTREEYGDSFAEKLTTKMTQDIDNASSKTTKVIKAFVHALTARCPRCRYTVGLDAYFCWIPLSYMPSFVVDYFMTSWTKDLVPACLQEVKKPEPEPTSTPGNAETVQAGTADAGGTENH